MGMESGTGVRQVTRCLVAEGWVLRYSWGRRLLMELLLRISIGLTAFLSLFTLFCFPSHLVGSLLRQPNRSFIKRILGKILAAFLMPIMPVKILLDAFPAFFAILGLVGVIYGIWAGDGFTMVTGLVGTLLFGRHVYRVTRPIPGFSQAFGPDWEKNIPQPIKARLSHKRYRFPTSKGTDGTGLLQKDVVIPTRRDSTPRLLGDIWEPASNVPRSGLALIHLHATAWQGMDKGQSGKTLFTRLNSQGHLVLDLAYSLAPEFVLEQMVDDVKYTIGWLKSQAEKYHIDPEKIVLMGESGGGHLALLAAYTPNHAALQPPGLDADTSICGVIAIHTPTDLALAFEEYGKMEPAQPEYSHQITAAMQPKVFDETPLDRMITRMRLLPAYRYQNMPGGILLMVNLLGGTLKEIPEKYALYSPITHMNTNSPPTLYLTGAHDYYYRQPYGEILHQALTRAGVPSVYYSFPETDHGFLLFFPRVSPSAQVGTYYIERFLAFLE